MYFQITLCGSDMKVKRPPWPPWYDCAFRAGPSPAFWQGVGFDQYPFLDYLTKKTERAANSAWSVSQKGGFDRTPRPFPPVATGLIRGIRPSTQPTHLSSFPFSHPFSSGGTCPFYCFLCFLLQSPLGEYCMRCAHSRVWNLLYEFSYAAHTFSRI